MPTLYLTREDGTLRRKGNALFWKPDRSGQGEAIPLAQIDDVVISGNGNLTTPTMQLLLELKIPVHFVSSSGKYLGSLTSGYNGSYAIKRAQYQSAFDPVKTAYIAESFILGKSLNQRATLQRAYYRSGRNKNMLKEAINEIDTLIDILRRQPELNAKRGIEGRISAVYFGMFSLLLAPPWKFTGRNRRPPKDPVNALLSYTYTLLLGTVTTAVITAGLDPCVGWLHPEYRGRSSAALDLMEEFRAPVADRLVVSLINRRVIHPDDFQSENGAVTMNIHAKRALIKEYSARLEESVTDSHKKIKSTYKNHIMEQSKRLKYAICKGSEYIPFLM